jgi:hypothetical protein
MITLTLNFPHAEWTVELPAVPRNGETVWWKNEEFTVIKVDWVAEVEGRGSVSVLVFPATQGARKLMAQEKAEARAEPAEFAKTNG